MKPQDHVIPMFIDFYNNKFTDDDSRLLAALLWQELPPPKDIKNYDGPVKLDRWKTDSNGEKTPYIVELNQCRYSIILSNSLIMRESLIDTRNPIRYEVLPTKEQRTREKDPLLKGKGAFGLVVIVELKVKLLKDKALLQFHRLPRAMKIVALYASSVSSISLKLVKLQIAQELISIFNENKLLQRVYKGVKNIVVHFDPKKDALKTYLLMPLLKGMSLLRWINKPDKSLLERLKVSYRIAKRTEDLHRRQIIHRDLKPENMLYDEENNNLYIADFGLATLTMASKNALSRTVGTIDYVAPEVINKKEATFAVDTFSNAGIFGHLFSNRPKEVTQERCEFNRAKLPPYNLNSLLADDELKNQCQPDQDGWIINFINKMASEDPRHRPSDEDIVGFVEQQIKSLDPTQGALYSHSSKTNQKTIQFKRNEPMFNGPTITLGVISILLLGIGLLTLFFVPPIMLFGIVGLFQYLSLIITGLGMLGLVKLAKDIYTYEDLAQINDILEPILGDVENIPNDEIENSLVKFKEVLGFNAAVKQFIPANKLEDEYEEKTGSNKPLFAPQPSQNPAGYIDLDTLQGAYIPS